MTAARLANLALIVFVGGYIVPGAIMLGLELAAYILGLGPAKLPYPAPAWPMGS